MILMYWMIQILHSKKEKREKERKRERKRERKERYYMEWMDHWYSIIYFSIKLFFDLIIKATEMVIYQVF